MTLAAQIKTDAEIFHDSDEFGEVVIYVPKVGPPATINITALVDPSFDVTTGTLTDSRQSISIQSNVLKGIVNPKPGDLVTIRGRVCRVEDVIQSAEDGMHDLIVEVPPP